MTASAVEILTDARRTLRDEDSWEKGGTSRDGMNDPVHPCHVEAVRWSLDGALRRAIDGGWFALDHPALVHVNDAVERLHHDIYWSTKGYDDVNHMAYMFFNDHPTTTHADVMAVLDSAIASAKQRGERDMGTRALVRIFDEGSEIACIYRHMDGSPAFLGRELKHCTPNRVVNGYSYPEKKVGMCMANGMGCLAALVVKGLKVGIGDVYLYAPGSKDVDEDYVYEIWAIGTDVYIRTTEVTSGASSMSPVSTYSPDTCLEYAK